MREGFGTARAGVKVNLDKLEGRGGGAGGMVADEEEAVVRF